MKKLIYILLIVLLSSCNTYRLASYYDDPIYFNGEEVEVIDSYSDLNWKMKTDFSFRWDFAQYAMNQPLSWYYQNPRLDGIWRPYNRFDIWFNSTEFWYDWAFNYNFGWNSWRWNSWNYPYHYNWNYGWNNWRWNNRIDNYWGSNNTNIAFVSGRRGSRISNQVNNVVTNYNVPRVINNISVPRINNRIPTPDNIDIVIEGPKRNFVGRFLDKLEGNGVKVRTYNNPNQYNNDQIIINNTRGNWRTESGNNGWRSRSRENIPTQTTPTRQFTPIQSGQVRGGSRSSVPQQTRSSVQSSSQGRSSSGRIQN